LCKFLCSDCSVQTEGPLIPAVQFLPRRHVQNLGKALVELDAVLYAGVARAVALQSPVDDVCHHPIARQAIPRDVRRCGLPLINHYVVATRFILPRCHPEVDGRSEGQLGVTGDLIRVGKKVQIGVAHEGPEGNPCRSVVVVP